MTDAPSRRRLRVALLALGVFALTCLVFVPALDADWVLWDDDRNFTENYAWRGLSAEHLRWMWTTFHMGPYQPLTWMSYGLDFTLWGLDARAFHVTNLALHALAATLVFLAARRLIGVAVPNVASWLHDTGGVLTALFFGIHPLRCESVCWITERRDVLSGVLFAATLVAWIAHTQSSATRKSAAYWASIVLFALSLLAKATGMMLPLALLVLDVYPLRRSQRGWRALVVEKLPLFALSLAFGAAALRGQALQGDTLQGLATLGIGARVSLAAHALLFYVEKTIWPQALLPIYEMRGTPRFVFAIGGAIVLTIALVAWRRRAPALLAAWIAFVVIVAPVSGLAQAGRQLAADRYTYLSCMPFAVLFGGSLVWIASIRPALHRAVLGIGAIVTLALGFAAFRQADIWTSSERLWSWTLDHDPASATAVQNLGAAHLLRGANAIDPAQRDVSLMKARELFQREIDRTDQPQSWVNLGLVTLLQATGDESARRTQLERALQEIEKGIAVGRERGQALAIWRLHRGVVLYQLGRVDEALTELEEFVAHEPNSLQGRRTLSLVLASAGKSLEAIDQLLVALEMEPDDATLWLRMAALQTAIGRVDGARAAYERVVEVRTRAIGAEAAEADPFVKQARAALAQHDATSGGPKQ